MKELISLGEKVTIKDLEESGMYDPILLQQLRNGIYKGLAL